MLSRVAMILKGLQLCGDFDCIFFQCLFGFASRCLSQHISEAIWLFLDWYFVRIMTNDIPITIQLLLGMFQRCCKKVLFTWAPPQDEQLALENGGKGRGSLAPTWGPVLFWGANWLLVSGSPTRQATTRGWQYPRHSFFVFNAHDQGL